MTSVDSGIETSNNSDDSSIAQREIAETEEISNVSSALATINSNQNDIREIDLETLRIELGCERSIRWPKIQLPLCQFSSISENYRYPQEVESSLSTSSSGRIVLPNNVVSTGNHLAQRKYNYSRKLKSFDRSFHRTRMMRDVYDIRTHPIEDRMRMAAATNNIMTMRTLLNSGASPNNCNSLGRTPLHIASCRGHTEMVRLLLEHGADPNLRDCVGNTPLHLAAATSKISVVTLLLNAGIDPLCLNQEGYNPLQLAETKLRLLQNCKGEDMSKIKEEVQEIVRMSMAYLQKHKDNQKKMETLITFCSRLSLSNTSEEVQDDVKDLLANVDTLSITQ